MIRLSITSGTGPAEVQEFVRLLKDRFLELLTPGGFVTSVVEYPGTGAGLLKHVEIFCEGNGLSELLSSEIGTHALLKQSALREGHKRKRWFAGVSAAECIDSKITSQLVNLKPEDLKITTALAGGPGGQNVNKRFTKVRVLHLPTGISVSSTRERSQHQNRQVAMQLLEQRLEEMEQAKKNSLTRQKWLKTRQVERGRPKRTYTEQKGVLIEEGSES